MRRFAVVALVLLLAAAAGLFVALKRRGGRQYEGELAALLPPDTAVYLSLRGLEDLWGRVESLEIFRQFQDEIDLAALVMSEDDWRRHQMERDTADYQVKKALSERFIRRWFGRTAAGAMFAVDNEPAPAFAVLARTDLGFEESLAELIAQWSPELALDQQDYRGIRLCRYRGKTPSKSLTYCRFGKTVALSLRSDSFAPLEAMVDRRLDPSAPSLASNPEFANGFSDWALGEGLAAYVDAPRMFSALERWDKLHLEKKKWRKGAFLFFRGLTTPLQRLIGRLRLGENPLGLSGVFRAANPSSGTGPERAAGDRGREAPSRIPGVLPPETLLCVGGRSHRLGEVLRAWTFGFPEDSEMRGKAAQWAALVRQDFAMELEGELLPLLRGEMGVACTGVGAGLGLPAVHAAAMAQTADSQALRALLERAYAHYERQTAQGKAMNFPGLQRRQAGSGGEPYYELPTLFPGVFEIGMAGDFLAVCLQSGALEALRSRLADSAAQGGLNAAAPYALAGFEPQAPYSFMAYANLSGAKQTIDNLAERSLLWRDKIRSSVRDWQEVLEALDLLRGARISARAGGGEVEVFVPLR